MYPVWSYYPRNTRPPEWVDALTAVVRGAEDRVSTLDSGRAGLTSDTVLAAIADGLVALGYAVETGKTRAARIRRPVLFGENGVEAVSYEIDAFHDAEGIVVEVEAGRGARGNAAYRDLVRTSLILDAQFFALLMPVNYRHQSGGRSITVRAYEEVRAQLDAIYASARLKLPFAGTLLVGY